MPAQTGTGKAGLAEEMSAAVEALRAAPHSIEPRMALFQFACVTGQWDRARTQLDTMCRLDRETTVFARVYSQLIGCEAERAGVFAGRRKPIVLGQPTPWLAMLVTAFEQEAAGTLAAARDLRGRALDEATPRPGSIDGTNFSWIMDADLRLGPILEIIVEGQYRWLPFDNIRRLRAEEPTSLRDMVWQPATVTLVNEGELSAFVPSRYPGSESYRDDAVRRANATVWVDRGAGDQIGFGQKMLATDVDDRALLDIRRLDIEASRSEDQGG
jgi:type VI secretion system protein ImpE